MRSRTIVRPQRELDPIGDRPMGETQRLTGAHDRGIDRIAELDLDARGGVEERC